jgi:hypothetical protein
VFYIMEFYCLLLRAVVNIIYMQASCFYVSVLFSETVSSMKHIFCSYLLICTDYLWVCHHIGQIHSSHCLIMNVLTLSDELFVW